MAANPYAIQRLTQLLLRGMARLFPPPPLEEATQLTEEELKRKYKWLDRIGNFVLIPVAIVALGVALYFLFRWLADVRYRALGEVAFLVYVPNSFEIGVYTSFMAIMSGPVVALLLLRLYLGPSGFKEYIAYGSHYRIRTLDVASRQFITVPIHGVKAYWALCLATCLPMLILLGLRINTFTAFTHQNILDNDFSSLRTVERSYSEIRGNYEIRGYHGRFQDFMQPYQAIIFNNGAIWKTVPGKGGVILEAQRKALQFAAQKSGKPVQVVNFIEDIPDLPRH